MSELQTPAGQVLLGLPRPQYVSVPEAFITALAWQVFDVEQPPDPKGRTIAQVYERKPSARQPRTLALRETRPRGRDLGAFGSALIAHGIEAELGPHELAEAVAHGLAGVQSTKGSVRAAIPMSPTLALLQNLSGLQSAANPPALGKIIERMYALGAPIDGNGQNGASGRWLEAADRRCKLDPLVRAFDAAATDSLLDCPPNRIEPPRVEDATGLFEGTPFSWFHRNWNLLCEPRWVDALPARVWVDWASTVLRLGIGFGYLWEQAWYEALARWVVLGRGRGTWDELRGTVPDVMPWVSRGADTSIRDVTSPLKSRIRCGEQVRLALTKWLEKTNASEEFPELLEAMTADRALVGDLTEALSTRVQTGSANNLWEAIRYALLVREATGENADHYGLLRPRGTRYSVPDPGLEWVAALASLACHEPGGESNVGAFMSELRELGVRPELAEIIQRLEEAGLARGSADADQAVQIRAAF